MDKTHIIISAATTDQTGTTDCGLRVYGSGSREIRHSPLEDDNSSESEFRSAWYSHLISPKSNRSVATVPMPGPLAEVLTNYLASWRPNEKRLLFSNLRGNPYSENKVVQKRLWPVLDALSIPRCGMHAFRHGHGSLMHSSGASLKVAQAQLRHADASTTSRYYLHVIGSEQRDAAEKVAQILCPDVAKSERKSMNVN